MVGFDETLSNLINTMIYSKIFRNFILRKSNKGRMIIFKAVFADCFPGRLVLSKASRVSFSLRGWRKRSLDFVFGILMCDNLLSGNIQRT